MTKQYTYGDSTWKDLLTGFGELTYTYDEIGNVIRTENTRTEEVTEYSWSKGRRLEKIERGTEKTEYTYNRDGIRIGKSVQGGNVRYIVDGTKILKQIGTGAGKTLEFYYDAGGELVGFRYEGSDYYYGKNVQGDVTELYRNGVLIATYEYDAWGKLISLRDANGTAIADRMDSAHAAAVNPIRYRGYYYDVETRLYYVSSRYYDPETCRFINADSQLNTSLGVLGCNMFAYCLNNPVNMADYSGNKPGDLFDTMDEAARDFAEYINEKSIELDREYGSFIYSKTVTETRTTTYINPNIFGSNPFSWLWRAIFGGGMTKSVTTKVKVTKYSYVEPKKGSSHSVLIPINWFGVKKKVAEIHTHGAYSPGYSNDNFSSADLNKWINYLVTPLGTVRKYDPSDGSNIIIYTDVPFDSNHPSR